MELNALKLRSKFAVEVQNVVFSYKKNLKILNNISVQIPEGEIYALLGSNGCGKTTLTRLILGRLKPEKGSIRIFGRDPIRENSNIPASSVGYMPQEIALFKEFTVEEMLQFFGSIYKMQKNEINRRIEHFIEIFKLPEKERKISELSGGQQRLVSIAVTMIHRPSLLILDEPTVGVDSLLRCQMWQYLNKLCKDEGVTVLIITHYTEEARSAATVGFMRSGTLITQSNPNDLMEKLNSLTLEDAFFQLCDEKNVEIIANNMTSNVEYSKISNNRKEFPLENNRELINFSNLKVLLHKSYIKVRGNPISLFLFYLLPVIQITALELCFGQKPIKSPIAIYNGEVVPKFSQIFIDTIDRKYLNPKFYDTNETAINTVINGKNWFAITFEKEFSESFETRFLNPTDFNEQELNSSKIKLYTDMSNTVIGDHIQRELFISFGKFIRNLSLTMGYNPNAMSQPIIIEKEFYGSYDSSVSDYFAPGVLMAVLHSMPMIVAAFMLVIERKDGHLERVFVAGVKPTEVLIINIIMLFIAISLQVLLSMILAFGLYNIPLRGSYLDTYALLVCQSLQGISFGQFLSLCFDEEYSVMVAQTVVMIPLWFSSGLIWPLEAVPYALRLLLYLNPLSFPVESLRSVMLRGWGINNVNVLIGYIVSIIYTLILSVMNFVIFEKFSTSAVSTVLLNKFKNNRLIKI